MRKLQLLLFVILISFKTFSATINAGIYSVKSGGDYNNLASAISALNSNGITGNGNVIFEIGDNQFLSEQTINDISGANASSQIIFRAEAGTTPVITFNLSSSGNAGITFNGTDYVTFDGWNQQGSVKRDITFKLSGNYGKIFEFKDGTDCEYNTIKNLNLIGYSNSVYMDNSAIFYNDGSDDNYEISHITISNNYIYKFANGIRIIARISDDNNYIDIKDNLVGPTSTSNTDNITYCGIAVTGGRYVNIINNEIQNIQYTSGGNGLYGIDVETIDSLVCDTNFIHNITANQYAWGIKIRGFWSSSYITHGYRIAKNTITDIYTQSTGAAGTEAAGICMGLLYPDGLIDNNKIYNIYTQRANASPAGIGTWAVGALKNITFSKNKIYRIYNATNADDSQTIYSGRGIYFDGTLAENIIIVNNFIYAIGGGSNLSTSAYNSGDFNETYPFGIMINTSSRAGSSPQIKIYHNSVYMTVDAKTNSSETAYPLNSATSCFAGAIGIKTTLTNFIDMRNNIFYNTISPVHTNQFKPQYPVMLYETTNPFYDSDYNIYKMERQLHSIWCKNRNYVAAVGGGSTGDAKPLTDNNCDGGAGSSSYGSGCADLQDFTGNDAHSRNHSITFACSGYPPAILTDTIIFIGSDDLHIDLSDAIPGTDLGITEDGDGDTRTTPYSIGADQGDGALPIVLGKFTANPTKKKTVKLKWETLAEINNDYFTIERSKDAKNWETIKILKAVGNSASTNFYNTIDNNPYNGVSYYRLKQTDFDGKYKYLGIKSVNININTINNKIKIYPNPSNGKITIEGNPEELETINIYNVIGENLTGLVTISKNSNKKIVIDLSNLSNGMYFIKTKTFADKVYKKY